MDKKLLEQIYSQYSKRELVFPDPVGFLYDFEAMKDKEIVGLIASALAYGRVQQINKSVAIVIEKMKPSPSEFLINCNKKELQELFKGFKHRFTTEEELISLLIATKKVIKNYGSLQNCLYEKINKKDDTIFPALCAFTNEILSQDELEKNSLLPKPEKGSACKRLNLYMRWMVREDQVDPGGWNEIPKSKLLMPIDTHIHKFSLASGFTERKNADMKATIEVTRAFQKICPEDPVRYDFALTKASIVQDDKIKVILKRKLKL